jgi:hypothetical protein
LTNLLEKILTAFESSAQVSNRVADSSDEEEESPLSRKITDLTSTVIEMRRDVTDIRSDQTAFEVYFLLFFLH